MTKLDAELAALPAMATVELRARWQNVTGFPIPKVSPALLRLALAYELQVKAHGGLSRQVQRQLDAASRTRTRAVVPGMRLAREWSGTVHIVTVDDAGAINWNGRSWRSLSEVARAITGTRWSGPAFFGLKQKAKAA